MTDLTALYDETATHDEFIAAMQHVINTGDVWRMEGSMGRMAMGLIESGDCMLGENASTDYWGNRIPSRYEVKDGTKGSESYMLANSGFGE